MIMGSDTAGVGKCGSGMQSMTASPDLGVLSSGCTPLALDHSTSWLDDDLSLLSDACHDPCAPSAAVSRL